MKRIILFMIVLSIVVIFGCDRPVTIAETGGSFAGIVVDSVTQQPIDSVAISIRDTIGDPSVFTDSIGSFKSVTFGSTIKIFAQKAGYHTKSKQVNITNNPTNIKFELVKQ